MALFGGLGLYAAAGLGLAEAEAQARLGPERWTALSARTSVLPFAAILAGRARLGADVSTSAVVLTALAIYLLYLGAGHLRLVGIDPLAPLAH